MEYRANLPAHPPGIARPRHSAHRTHARTAGCLEEDLLAADRVIALKEDEHRPHMLKRWPDWADRIEYWHVHDLDMAGADEAIPAIERQVHELLDELRQSHATMWA